MTMAFAPYYQRAKKGIHALQALIIFIGALITIAIFTKGGQGDGRINYYFVLVRLTSKVTVDSTLLTDTFYSACSAYPLSSTRPPSLLFHGRNDLRTHTPMSL